MEGEFRKGGEGRLHRMAKGDVMMKGGGGGAGVVILYPSHLRPLASLIFFFIPPSLLPFNCLFQKIESTRETINDRIWTPGALAGIAHSGTSKKGSGLEPCGVQVKHLPALCQ